MKTNAITIVNKLTNILYIVYIVSMISFENYKPTTWIASYSLYFFIILTTLYIILKGRVKFTYYTIIMMAYGSLLAISLFWAKDFDYGLQTLYWYFTCVIITFLVSNFIDSKDKFYFTLNTYILGGTLLALLNYVLYGLEIFNIAANSKYGIRLGGDIGNANAIGLSLAFGICFSLYMLLNFKNNNIKKILYILSIIICLPILLLTGSKKSLFVILFGVIFVFLIFGPDKKTIFNRIKGVLIALGLLFVLFWLINNVSAFWYIGQRVEELFMTLGGYSYNSSDLARIVMVDIGLKEFAKSPFIGNGIAHSNYMFGTYAHNNYVEILMNTGLLGFFIYYATYFISIRKIHKLYKHQKKIAVIISFIFITFIIIETGLVLYYSRYYQILLVSIVTLCELREYKYGKKN